ncbi:MAG: redox-sensing transcriptional repressor Rex [Candidatus Delongbacteria bacterium]|jgi:redox-sensing transcriptional repressor|nr:redox-sensing transcriptional repressor Rex [Candidatus Delongbacteria bacterium]
MNKVSEKTIERISLYRRRLVSELAESDFVLSRHLADISNSTDVQVRRDLMHLGCKGAPRKGYSTKELLKSINSFLDPIKSKNVIIVGLQNFSRSIFSVFKDRKQKLSLVACFDIDESKVGTSIDGIPCYHIDNLSSKIKEMNVNIGILSCSDSNAQSVSDMMIVAGIKSIVNFTCHPLNITRSDIYIEQIDITAAFEKAAYYSKSILFNADKINKINKIK